MSNKVQALAKGKVLGGAPIKAVFMNMADSASDDGSGIWTGKPTIAKETELNLSTVKRAVKALIEMGLVSEHGKKKCAAGFTILYGINLDVLEALTPVHGEPPSVTTPVHGEPTPVHGEPRGGSGCPPNHYGTTKNQEKSNDLFGSEKKGKTPRRVAAIIPEDWKPSEKTLEFGEELGFQRAAILRLVGPCVDYHRSKGNKHVDFEAVFRTWLRNDVKFNGAPNGRSEKDSQDGSAPSSVSSIMAHQRALKAGRT